MRVLLIEDNPGDARLIVEMLKGSKTILFELKHADCLSTGLEYLANETFNVVLLNLSLPESQGMYTFKRVKAHNKGDLPIVAMTGPSDTMADLKIIQEGAEDYLIKGQITGDGLIRSLCYSVKRKQLEKKLHNLLNETIKALGKLSKTRDPYTAGHESRVAALATTIAREMGLLEDRVEGIRIAGFLHDVGKIIVPAEILSKPGSLNEFEFSIIKQHSLAGSEILEDIEFPWEVAKTVLQHHERINSSGYPQGLSGDNIILEAKVLAVADVVEAMSSHRPYRAALGVGKALEEISKNKGILYASEVVGACLKVFEKGFEFEPI